MSVGMEEVSGRTVTVSGVPLTGQASHVTLEDSEPWIGRVDPSDLHLIRSNVRHLCQLQHLHWHQLHRLPVNLQRGAVEVPLVEDGMPGIVDEIPLDLCTERRSFAVLLELQVAVCVHRNHQVVAAVVLRLQQQHHTTRSSQVVAAEKGFNYWFPI